MTFLQFYIIVLCLGFVGLLFMTGITLLISSRGKNPFISVVTAAAILYIPAVDVSSISLLADKLLKLFPFNVMNSSRSFEIGVLYNIFGHMLTQPVMMALVAALALVISIPLTCRAFKNHQVVH